MAIVVMHVAIFILLFRLMRTAGLAMILLVATALCVLHFGSDLSAYVAGLRYPWVGPTIVWLCLAVAWLSVAYLGRLRPQDAGVSEVANRS